MPSRHTTCPEQMTSAKPDLVASAVPIHEHADAVTTSHRFGAVLFDGSHWDLVHLDPFALRLDPGLGVAVDVVVLFSCHCFTRTWRAGDDPSHAFEDGAQLRTLDPERYALSRQYLPALIRELPSRKIQVSASDRHTFVTFELRQSPGSETVRYAVFFEVTRDRKRERRMLLRVQSAYHLETLVDRQRKAPKVRFGTLLSKVYRGEDPIKS